MLIAAPEADRTAQQSQVTKHRTVPNHEKPDINHVNMNQVYTMSAKDHRQTAVRSTMHC